MGSTRNDQSAAQADTDILKAEEESLTTNKATAVSPLGRGSVKTTIRWLSPIYGQRIVKVKASGGGKKG